MLNCWKMPVLDEVVPFWAAVTGRNVAIATDCGILNIGASIFLTTIKYFGLHSNVIFFIKFAFYQKATLTK